VRGMGESLPPVERVPPPSREVTFCGGPSNWVQGRDVSTGTDASARSRSLINNVSETRGEHVFAFGQHTFR